jgi:hypothetical protein
MMLKETTQLFGLYKFGFTIFTFFYDLWWILQSVSKKKRETLNNNGPKAIGSAHDPQETVCAGSPHPCCAFSIQAPTEPTSSVNPVTHGLDRIGKNEKNLT